MRCPLPLQMLSDATKQPAERLALARLHLLQTVAEAIHRLPADCPPQAAAWRAVRWLAVPRVGEDEEGWRKTIVPRVRTAGVHALVAVLLRFRANRSVAAQACRVFLDAAVNDIPARLLRGGAVAAAYSLLSAGAFDAAAGTAAAATAAGAAGAAGAAAAAAAVAARAPEAPVLEAPLAPGPDVLGPVASEAAARAAALPEELVDTIHELGHKALQYVADTRHRQWLPGLEMLLAIPELDPAMMVNGALETAARRGNGAIVHRLLEDPRVSGALLSSSQRGSNYNRALYAVLRSVAKGALFVRAPHTVLLLRCLLAEPLADATWKSDRHLTKVQRCAAAFAPDIAAAAWSRRRAVVLARALALEEV